MYTYEVAEHFISINGEGPLAGELALFIRFKGCNLRCSYCDTAWAAPEDAPCTVKTGEEILKLAEDAGVKNITLTGGEPLFRPHMHELIRSLSMKGHHVEIETNGSIPLSSYKDVLEHAAFTMDYKLPDSGMESYLQLANLELLEAKDTVNFVASSHSDLDKAAQIIEQYNLTERCHVYLSPVFGRIDPKDIVAYMIKHNMNGLRLQLQMHKFIWDPEMRGV